MSGLELTASDLIKNYLMSLVASKGRGDLKYILNRWMRMTNHIGAGRLPNFLRHYFNTVDVVEYYPKALKAEIRDPVRIANTKIVSPTRTQRRRLRADWLSSKKRMALANSGW